MKKLWVNNPFPHQDLFRRLAKRFANRKIRYKVQKNQVLFIVQDPRVAREVELYLKTAFPTLRFKVALE